MAEVIIQKQVSYDVGSLTENGVWDLEEELRNQSWAKDPIEIINNHCESPTEIFQYTISTRVEVGDEEE